jgi:hypothetical protein
VACTAADCLTQGRYKILEADARALPARAATAVGDDAAAAQHSAAARAIHESQGIPPTQ